MCGPSSTAGAVSAPSSSNFGRSSSASSRPTRTNAFARRRPCKCRERDSLFAGLLNGRTARPPPQNGRLRNALGLDSILDRPCVRACVRAHPVTHPTNQRTHASPQQGGDHRQPHRRARVFRGVAPLPLVPLLLLPTHQGEAGVGGGASEERPQGQGRQGHRRTRVGAAQKARHGHRGAAGRARPGAASVAARPSPPRRRRRRPHLPHQPLAPRPAVQACVPGKASVGWGGLEAARRPARQERARVDERPTPGDVPCASGLSLRTPQLPQLSRCLGEEGQARTHPGRPL